MKLAVYSGQAPEGPLILVPVCMRPGIDVERWHGPLEFRGVVDTDEVVSGIDWQPSLDAVRGDLQALIACPVQKAALLPTVDMRTSADGMLLAGDGA